MVINVYKSLSHNACKLGIKIKKGEMSTDIDVKFQLHLTSCWQEIPCEFISATCSAIGLGLNSTCFTKLLHHIFFSSI